MKITLKELKKLIKEAVEDATSTDATSTTPPAADAASAAVEPRKRPRATARDLIAIALGLIELVIKDAVGDMRKGESAENIYQKMLTNVRRIGMKPDEVMPIILDELRKYRGMSPKFLTVVDEIDAIARENGY